MQRRAQRWGLLSNQIHPHNSKHRVFFILWSKYNLLYCICSYFSCYSHSINLTSLDNGYKLETRCILYTLSKLQFALFYLFLFIEITVQHALTKIVREKLMVLQTCSFLFFQAIDASCCFVFRGNNTADDA